MDFEALREDARALQVRKQLVIQSFRLSQLKTVTNLKNSQRAVEQCTAETLCTDQTIAKLKSDIRRRDVDLAE
jgi:hypothetical protein